MPSPNERRRNNIRAGIFVSVTLILAITVVMILSGIWQSFVRTTARYTASFPVSSGVNNLQPGAGVRVGGVGMGTVVDVRPNLVEGETFRDIHVEFDLDSNVILFADARVFITSPLLGTDAWIDIPDVGTTESGPAANVIIDGATGAGLLTTLLGPEGADDAKGIIGDARKFAGMLSAVPDDYETHVIPTLENIHETSERFAGLAATVRDEDGPRWSAGVDRIMTWTGSFTESLDTAVAEANGLMTDARGVVEENREPVGRIVGNVEAVTERVRDETMEQVAQLLETGQRGLDSAVETLATIQSDYDGWATDLGETLGNATLASQQLKLTTAEVRRSPWKLLYRPSVAELEHELLYDSARSFAVAAADLKAAAASVDRVLAKHGDRLREDPDLFDRVTRNLVDPLQRYEKAQRQLFDVLLADAP